MPPVGASAPFRRAGVCGCTNPSKKPNSPQAVLRLFCLWEEREGEQLGRKSSDKNQQLDQLPNREVIVEQQQGIRQASAEAPRGRKE
jgi:hypothetical protein